MFEDGDIVVCIDKKSNYASYDGDSEGGNVDALTLGKKYEILFVRKLHNYGLSDKSNYFAADIVNDYNILDRYYGYRFISLVEYRKLKIKKICTKIKWNYEN